MSDVTADLMPAERDALHRAELGVEWLHRAHGNLLAFHHAVGHAMDHLAAAEDQLRASGHEEMANALRDEHLPRGVIDGDRWSYDVVEAFQQGFLTDVTAFEAAIREDLAGGRRHVEERVQEREWRERAED